MNPRTRPPVAIGVRSRRGSVILFVLGVVLLTAFLLTRLIDRAGTELLAETKAANRAALRDQAYAGLEVTLAVLADVAAADGGLYAPQQGWGRPLDYAGYEPSTGYGLSVSFEDETGKLPLATVDEAVLRHYLEGIGANVSDAERLTDAIMAWTKKGYLPASSDADPRIYENAPLPYEPPLRALRSFGELRAVSVARELFFDEDGRWSELGSRFQAGASIYDFKNVNINSAHSSALVGLGIDPAQAKTVTEEMAAAGDPDRDRRFYRSISEAASVYGGGVTQAGLGADVQCLRIRVAATQGARHFTLEAVVQPGGGRGNPQNSENGATNAPEKIDPNAPPPTPVAPRALTRKSIDYPFRILELREIDGPPQ